MKILLIDDERNFVDSIKEQLSKKMIIHVAYNGYDGMYLALSSQYDLIILDLVLPDMTGMDLCVELRRNKVQIPILVLTVKFGIKDKVTALDSGADDYVIKPVSLSELSARIRALTRRNKKTFTGVILKAHDLELNLDTRIVKRDNIRILLRRKEFDLLEYMVRNQNYVLSRSSIIDHVWFNQNEISSNTVDVHIKFLRDKIDKYYPLKLIKTIHGIGYMLRTN